MILSGPIGLMTQSSQASFDNLSSNPPSPSPLPPQQHPNSLPVNRCQESNTQEERVSYCSSTFLSDQSGIDQCIRSFCDVCCMREVPVTKGSL